MSAILQNRDFDESIDLRALGSKLISNRWWITTSVALFAAAFAAIAFMTTPMYRVTTIVAPASTGPDTEAAGVAASALGGLAAGLGFGPKDSTTEQAISVLKSREFTENFIVQRNLLPQLFPNRWNFVSERWKGGPSDRPTLSEAYDYFNTKVRSIVEESKTGLIRIQVDWTNQPEAADWANGMVSQLNDEMRARAVAQADASMQFLEKELQSATTVEVREAIAHLMEVQEKQRMLAHVTRDYSLTVVDRAIASDGERPIWPKKKLMVALGAVLGFMIGAIGVALFGHPPKNAAR